jgi:hypothetical protein
VKWIVLGRKLKPEVSGLVAHVEVLQSWQQSGVVGQGSAAIITKLQGMKKL